MNQIPEKCADKPNLWRVACELARYEHPDRILDALRALLESDPDMLHTTPAGLTPTTTVCLLF